jgi:multidrug efflux pump
MQIEDTASLGSDALYHATQEVIAKGRKDPALTGLFSSYQVGVPKIRADVDREKAKAQGVSLTDLFTTMQVYLGSLYVNDFNRFGRTFPVNVQAEQRFRLQAKDIGRLETRNATGKMIPIGAFVTPHETTGPDRVFHYNGLPTAEINGGPAPGFSTGQAQSALETLARQTLPNGVTFEWTELTYQKILAGNTAVFIFPLCVLLVFLVLVAQYESFTLPLVVILIVPMCLLCAIAGVRLTHGDNNVFTQIGLIVLVGLACKNAILIVEFARDREREGVGLLEAVLTACRLRLRPILMTSMAFIMGVAPLAVSVGAGSEMRRAMGIAVFSGMLGVTLFGLALTPIFYWTVRPP